MIKYLSPQKALKFINLWPPYLFSGISVENVNKEFTDINVKMVQRFYNTNFVGTHFGGSLYSMCDPFFMFILLQHLPNYIVWDQAAKIQFLKPARGTVRASFSISLEEINKIKLDLETQKKVRPIFHTNIIDENNIIIAEIEKTLYVRKKIS